MERLHARTRQRARPERQTGAALELAPAADDALGHAAEQMRRAELLAHDGGGDVDLGEVSRRDEQVGELGLGAVERAANLADRLARRVLGGRSASRGRSRFAASRVQCTGGKKFVSSPVFLKDCAVRSEARPNVTAADRPPPLRGRPLAALSPGAASGSRHLMVGLTDHAAALNADPRFFTTVGQLRAEVLRVNLYWGGPLGVARRRPVNGADPGDPAYDWRRYDRVVLNAARQRVRIAFSIFATPAWANRGRGRNRPPDNAVHLEKFAYAAAARYSGTWQRREDDLRLPPVRLWIAWNEPNLNLGLVPQFRKVKGKWMIQSARDYARICNAIYDGVHVTGAHGPAGRLRRDRAARATTRRTSAGPRCRRSRSCVR